MLGTVRPIRRRSAARVSRGWLVRGAHHERETPEPSIAYRLHASELVATFRTDERQGLGDEEARARLAQYGSNELAGHRWGEE